MQFYKLNCNLGIPLTMSEENILEDFAPKEDLDGSFQEFRY